MTQLQFEMICRIIENGAPALAGELCGALNALVVDRNQIAEKVETLMKKQEDSEGPCEAENESTEK